MRERLEENKTIIIIIIIITIIKQVIKIKINNDHHYYYFLLLGAQGWKPHRVVVGSNKPVTGPFHKCMREKLRGTYATKIYTPPPINVYSV